MAAIHSRAGKTFIFLHPRHIDDLSILIQVLHPLLGGGRPDYVAGQMLDGLMIFWRYSVAAEDVEP
jgi:hypothetical protein